MTDAHETRGRDIKNKTSCTRKHTKLGRVRIHPRAQLLEVDDGRLLALHKVQRAPVAAGQHDAQVDEAHAGVELLRNRQALRLALVAHKLLDGARNEVQLGGNVQNLGERVLVVNAALGDHEVQVVRQRVVRAGQREVEQRVVAKHGHELAHPVGEKGVARSGRRRCGQSDQSHTRGKVTNWEWSAENRNSSDKCDQ